MINHNWTLRRRVLLLLLGGWITWSLGGAARAAVVTVQIQNFAFNPPTVTIAEGDTITWLQKDAVGHSSVSDTGEWTGPLLSLNQTFSHTFNFKGTYPYHCVPHTSMRGTIVVLAPDTAPTVTLTSPLNGAVLPGPVVVQFEAAASDDTQVVHVEIFSGIQQLALLTTPPYVFSGPSFDPGSYTFHAVALDNSGKRGTSAPVNVTITAELPKPKFESWEIFPNGALFLNVRGVAGKDHVIEAAAGFTGWTPIHTNRPTTDTFSYLDPKASTPPRRFYRVFYR